jgi:hypothetical protein
MDTLLFILVNNIETSFILNVQRLMQFMILVNRATYDVDKNMKTISTCCYLKI